MRGRHDHAEGGRLDAVARGQPARGMLRHGRVQEDEGHIRQLFQVAPERLILYLRVLQDNVPPEPAVGVLVIWRNHAFQHMAPGKAVALGACPRNNLSGFSGHSCRMEDVRR